MASDEIAAEAAIWIIASGREPDETEKALTAAALRVWPRARAYARRALRDTSVADESSIISTAWEGALQSVLKSLRRRFQTGPVRDLDSYVFGAFIRRLKKVRQRERVVEYVATNQELLALRNAQDWDWVIELENTLELKKLVNQMDNWMKEVYFRRTFNHSWRRIAKDLGMTEHQAKTRFADGLKKIRKRIAESDKASG